MKIKYVFATALLALAGVAASAQAQVQANLNDLILGFRATGGQGSTSNLEVDLGSISQFYGQPAGTTIVVTRLSASDLSSIYGATWNTRTDLYWGIVGSAGRVGSGGPNGQPVSTLWATNAEATVGTLSTPWTPSSRSGQSLASGYIEPLYLAAPGSLTGKTATANSQYAANVNATLSGSYSAQDTVQPGVSFGAIFNPSVDNTTKIASGSYAVSDLYELRPGTSSATYIGSFGLGSDGKLTFSNSPGFFSPSGAPVIATQPVAQSVTSGSTVVFTTSATASGAVTYQWYLNGSAINGATTSRLVVTNATAASAGSYTVLATSAGVSSTSNPATLAITSTSNPGRLVNLSILTPIQSSMTLGFVVGGTGVSGNQSLLIRAVGPTLGAPASSGGFGYPGVMPDPSMAVIRQNDKSTLYTNTGWKTASDGGTLALNTAAATGAFPLINPSLDSAVVASVPPVSGGYSVQISGQSGDSGSVIAEIYDNTPNYTATSPRLVNISSLKQIASGTSLTMGFVIGGSTSKTVLIRAAGPALTGFGYSSGAVMADPKIVVQQQSNGAVLATNAGWGGDAQLTAAAAGVGGFAFTDVASKDSAVILTLPPVTGGYSATVSSASGGGGNVIVEVYEVP